MRRIFISYRRTDAQYAADSLYAQLSSHFGSDMVFMDIDDIPLGVNFRDYLDQQIEEVDIVLPLIGPNWLNALDAQGNRRLDNPNDFVRLEIEAALERKLRIIPLYLSGMQGISVDALPPSLQELSYLNAQFIRREPDFSRDVASLIRGLESILKEYDDQRIKNQESLASYLSVLQKWQNELDQLAETLTPQEKRTSTIFQRKLDAEVEQITEILADSYLLARVSAAGFGATVADLELQKLDLEARIAERLDGEVAQKAAAAAVQKDQQQQLAAKLAEEASSHREQAEVLRQNLRDVQGQVQQLRPVTTEEKETHAALSAKLESVAEVVGTALRESTPINAGLLTYWQQRLDALQAEIAPLQVVITESQKRTQVQLDQNRADIEALLTELGEMDAALRQVLPSSDREKQVIAELLDRMQMHAVEVRKTLRRENEINELVLGEWQKVTAEQLTFAKQVIAQNEQTQDAPSVDSFESIEKEPSKRAVEDTGLKKMPTWGWRLGIVGMIVISVLIVGQLLGGDTPTVEVTKTSAPETVAENSPEPASDTPESPTEIPEPTSTPTPSPTEISMPPTVTLLPQPTITPASLNYFRNFKLISDASGELVFSVDYTYSGDNGAILFSAGCLKNGEKTPCVVTDSNPFELSGQASGKLTVSLGLYGPDTMTTDKIFVAIYHRSGIGQVYYQTFDYIKQWTVILPTPTMVK